MTWFPKGCPGCSGWPEEPDIIEVYDNESRKLNTYVKDNRRSDLIERAHHYIDDLGCASIGEKDVFRVMVEDYITYCEARDISDKFIVNLANVVMKLPTRKISENDLKTIFQNKKGD